MPISAFWELSRNVDRIRAEEDSRFYRVVANIFSKKPQDFVRSLDKEKGSIVEVDKSTGKFDRAGFDRLKARMMMAR